MKEGYVVPSALGLGIAIVCWLAAHFASVFGEPLQLLTIAAAMLGVSVWHRRRKSRLEVDGSSIQSGSAFGVPRRSVGARPAVRAAGAAPKEPLFDQLFQQPLARPAIKIPEPLRLIDREL
jgi:hypothetical protein